MERRDFLKLMASGSAFAVLAPGCQTVPGAASDIATLDAISQAALIQRKEMTAADLLQTAIDRINRVDRKLNAVVTNTFGRALERARKGPEKAPLWGVPYLLKDLNPYRGVRLTMGSRAFLQNIADWQSPYTDKSEATGAIVLGKTNTPEFGLLSTTESVALGACANPWNLRHSAGGSSGGAAAAVAARLVPIAQASDGGGSIRIPAANCGLFGLKPSRGRFPLQSRDPGPWPLSIAHCLSWSVRDSAFFLALTERDDGGPYAPVGYVQAPGRKRLKIAMSLSDPLGRLPAPETVSAVERAAEILESRGHDVDFVDTTPLSDPRLVDRFLVFWAGLGAQIVQQVDKQTGGRAKSLLEPWTLGLARDFAAQPKGAMKEVIGYFRKVEASVDAFFDTWDAWLTPVVATPAPELGLQDPRVPYRTLIERLTRFAAWTPIHNVAGTPAMSVPMGWTTGGLPLSAQIAAARGKDAQLLQLAYELEEAQPWAPLLPPVHG